MRIDFRRYLDLQLAMDWIFNGFFAYLGVKLCQKILHYIPWL